jgi:hypothetical protein
VLHGRGCAVLHTSWRPLLSGAGLADIATMGSFGAAMAETADAVANAADRTLVNTKRE